MKKGIKGMILGSLLLFSFQTAIAGENCSWGKSEAKGKSIAEKSLITTSADKKKHNFPAISQADLVKAIEQKAVFLIDANSSEKYASGHIPSAVHFDKQKNAFTQKLPEDKSTLVVAYCGGPGCSAWCGAAEELHKQGYTNIKHYKGGIREWKSAGLKMNQKKKSKKKSKKRI